MNAKTNQNPTWLMLLLLLLVVAGFVQSVVALEPKITVFSDDFNAGDFKVDWTVTTTDAGSFEPSTAKYVSEPYSVYMDSMGTSRASAVSPVYELDLNKDYYVSFYFLIPDSSNHWFEVFNNHQIYLVIDSGTQLKCYVGNNNSFLVTDLSTDHWYHIEIITKPSSSNYDVYIDGDLKRTCPFWIHTGFEDCFQIGDREGTSNDYGEAYWDDVLITQGTLIRVDCGATGNNDGTGWADAFTSLQDGLDRAVRGDRIWVAAGTYKPASDYGLGIGDRGKHFRMKNRVAIYGGFPATGDPGWLDRDPNTNETILSGDLAGNDEPVTDPENLPSDPNRLENCYHVFYHPEETNLDPNALLDGFTISVGNADYSSSAHNKGGGMYNNESSPTVKGCRFACNFATYGGGMFNESSNLTLTNSFFINNSSDYGGGIYNASSSSTVNECTFSNNWANTFGGGMFNYYRIGIPIVINCTFINNLANAGGGMYNLDSIQEVSNCFFISNSTEYGGGISNYGSRPIVTNCSFSGNTAGEGGGMYNRANSNPTVTNCTFIGNQATQGKTLACDSFQQQNPSTVLIADSILWDGNNGIWNNDGSSITINYSDIQGGWLGSGTGNIDADPMFKDPNGVDDILGTADDNLQLAYNSPCIDAGNNTAVPLDTTDLDGDGNTTERIPLDLAGHARFTDDPLTPDTGVADPPDYPAVVDMGPYERYEFCGDDVVSLALKGDLNLDCYIDLLDFAIMATYWLQYIGPE